MADKSLFGVGGPHKANLDKSTFDLSFKSDLTARFGRVYPVLCQEAPPDSTFTIKPTMAFDLMPFSFPIQTNIRAHMAFYKVPLRILMKHGVFQDFTTGQGSHTLPYIKRQAGAWCEAGGLGDYMGLPTNVIADITQSVALPMLQVKLPQIFGHSGSRDLCGYVSTLPSVGSQYVINGFLDSSYDGSGYAGFITNALDGLLVSSGVTGDFTVVHLGNRPTTSMPTLNLFALLVQSDGTFEVLAKQELDYSSTAAVGKYFYKSSAVEACVRSNQTLSYKATTVGFQCDDSFISAVNNCDGEIHFYLAYPSTDTFFNSGVVPGFEPGVGITSGRLTKIDPESGDASYGSATPYLLGTAYGVLRTLNFNVIYPMPSRSASNPFASADGTADPRIPISAFPFRAYEFIKNYAFRQERIDPFIKDGVEVYNDFLTNDDEGADSTTPVDFFNAPYEFDMFTTCVKSPQWGNAPLVGITTNDLTNEGTMHMIPDEGDPYDIGVSLGTNGDILGISNYDDVADHTSVHRLQEAIDFGISINDFRNVSMFQKFLERYQRAGGYQYENFMKEFFGTNVPTGMNFPEFLGGCTRPVQVNKIENQSITDDHRLGEFAGVARVSGQCETIKCYCSEQSLIMGLMWFSVTPVMSQYLPKHFIKFDRLDFWNPAFNCVGPQPVFKKQLAPLELSAGEEDDVFGYNEPYVDLKMHFDECHGEFRGSMHNYILQRIFDGCPELGKDFIYQDSADLTNIFAVNSDTDKIFGCVGFDMKCKVGIPRYNVPRIIG